MRAQQHICLQLQSWRLGHCTHTTHTFLRMTTNIPKTSPPLNNAELADPNCYHVQRIIDTTFMQKQQHKSKVKCSC